MTQLEHQNETIALLRESISTNSKMMPKIGNNNNNTISINVFLNEKCKDAMNLTDFIDQLQVSLEDLDYSKTNGFVKGVTSILITLYAISKSTPLVAITVPLIVF